MTQENNPKPPSDTQIENKENLAETFGQILYKLPRFERIQPVCPIDGRVYSWADVDLAIYFNLEIKDRMLKKLRELDII